PNVTPTFDQITQVNLGGDLVFGDTINPGGLGGQCFLAVDRSGGPTNNNIYMIATVQPFGFNTGTDVMFARSTDGGLAFSAPHRINDDPINHNKWHWFGTLSVAPNGRLDAVWYDTRNAANNTDSQLFYSFSTDAGVTWSPNVAVSNAFNPSEGYPNQNKIGDYITIVSDNTGGNVAYAATFNFNPSRGQHEEDVYYVRVSPTGGATPTPTATASPTPTPTATASPTPTTTDTGFTNNCLPWTGHTYIILPYWDDLYLVNSGFGIFTSISGTAPNRIFNIEWRAQYFPGSGTANFELRLYEGQTRFDVIYGTVTNGNTSATAGVQRDDACFAQYYCNGSGGPPTGGWTLAPAGT